jgi:hypothetical protein
MENSQVVATGVNAVLGIILALLFKFFPGLKTWFANLKPDARGGLVLGLITLIIVAQFLLSWAGVLSVFEVSADGAWAAVIVWVFTMSGNQITYLTTRKIGTPK